MLSHIEPRKILIIKPSALGDIVHSLPLLRALKICFPGVPVHWVVAKGLDEFLRGHPMIEKLWIIDKSGWKKPSRFMQTLSELRQLANGLKSEQYDLTIDMQGLLRTGIISIFTKSIHRLGFKEAREGAPMFYTDRIEGSWENIHAVDRYMLFAEALGCKDAGIEFPFAPFDENIPLIGSLPSEYIIMAPSAGKEANRWPAERFGQLAARLDLPTVAISSKADIPVVDRLVRASDGKAISIAGKTGIMELAAVIRKARCLISNDTGPMHIAAALDVPVFAIFGPSNPVRTGPYGEIHTVIQKNLSCVPCYRKKKCGHWECLEKLTVEDVLEVIRRKMSTGK